MYIASYYIIMRKQVLQSCYSFQIQRERVVDIEISRETEKPCTILYISSTVCTSWHIYTTQPQVLPAYVVMASFIAQIVK